MDAAVADGAVVGWAQQFAAQVPRTTPSALHTVRVVDCSVITSAQAGGVGTAVSLSRVGNGYAPVKWC